jgi:hypothetical protein
MNKFTKVVESDSQKKYFQIQANVTLAIKSDTDSSAAHLAEMDLGGLEYLSNFEIVDISEVDREEYKEMMLSEQKISKSESINQSVKMYWDNKFGESKPKLAQILEFYHFLRMVGNDKNIILDTLKEKIPQLKNEKNIRTKNY